MHMSAYLQRAGWGGILAAPPKTGGISELLTAYCMQGKMLRIYALDPGLGGLFRALRATVQV